MASRSLLTLGAAALALATVATPALAAKKAHHKAHHAASHHTTAATSQDAAVDRLNAQSLNAARSGNAPAVGSTGQ